MIIVTAEYLASHLAGSIDGEYDDGLEASVSARAKGNVIMLELSEPGSTDGPTRFRLTVEAV